MQLARVSTDDETLLCAVVESELIPLSLTDDERTSRSWLQWSSADVEQRASGPAISGEHVRYLPAVAAPEKIIAVGLNYHDHALESDFEPPTVPLLFAKTNNALAAHGDVISCPSNLTERPDYEAELAVVIGKVGHRVQKEEAFDYVFAYSIANDISARDAQFADGQWFRGKSFDGFCPIGPYLTLADSVPNVMQLRISTRLNGETVQSDQISSMIFGIDSLISYISKYLTLRPGDVILTGTPSGVGFAKKPPRYLRDGDSVDVEIESLGTLHNEISTSVLPKSGERTMVRT